MADPEDKKPYATVIIAAHNAERTIASCLDGVAQLQGSPGSFETIVVDDGSSDATAEILSRHDVRVLHQPNRGPASARNRGAREARGEILLFTDSDCIPNPDWLGHMLRRLEDPSVAAVKGAYRTEQRSLAARFAQVEFEERYDVLEKAGTCDMLDTYSAAIRADVFDACGGFDERFPEPNNEDTELSYRLCEEGYRIVFERSAVVRHLRHPETLRDYLRLKYKRGFWRMVVYKRFPMKALRETYTPWSLKLQIGALGLAFVGVLVGILNVAVGGSVLIASVLLGCMASCRLARTAWKHDRGVLLALPVLIPLRAASLALGAAVGCVFARARERPARELA